MTHTTILAGWLLAGIASDERVVFFPTYGVRDAATGTWIVHIHGWIFEPEKDDRLRRAAFDAFRRALGLKENDAASTTLRDRAWPFLVDNERAKRITIRIGAKEHAVGVSAANGLFSAALTLSDDEVKQALSQAPSGPTWLPFRAVTRPGDARQFDGRTLLVPDKGVSIVSDIDDTIKITEVGDVRAALANTFLREFRDVPGMAAVYQRWAKDGAAFHYVSDSPWQLFEPLHAFRKDKGFPEGTVDLKLFRWKDESFFDLFRSPEQRKLATIGKLLADFPQREFILVGDSGQRDPEIFGELARRHPKQVRRILIRNITGEGADDERWRKSFRDVPAERWRLFREAKEIAGAV